MSLYLPVANDRVDVFRAGIEGMLSSDPSVVAERIDILDHRIQEFGYYATFGTEVEVVFAGDPQAPFSTLTDGRIFYEDVVAKLQDRNTLVSPYGKGEVIPQGIDNPPIMVSKRCNNNYCDGEQAEASIVEIRTSPAGPNKANERYWKVLQAISEVAAESGTLALILGTHQSVAVMRMGGRSNRFIDFTEKPGGMILGSVQHNLNSINSLQVDAGLEAGISVLEAFPGTKDATTTIHERRLEMRHPLVGIIDPRIDELAILEGISQAITGSTPKAAMERTRSCSKVTLSGGASGGLDSIVHYAVWDTRMRRLVAPAVIESSAITDLVERGLDLVVQTITGDMRAKAYANNGQAIRSIINALRSKRDRLYVSEGFPDSGAFRNAVKGAKMHRMGDVYRVVPEIINDSPDVHRARRQNILRSSVARRILGDIQRHITSAEESMAIRQELVDQHMIVMEDAANLTAT